MVRIGSFFRFSPLKTFCHPACILRVVVGNLRFVVIIGVLLLDPL